MKFTRRLEFNVMALEVISFLALISTGELKSWIALITGIIAMVAYVRNLILLNREQGVSDRWLLATGTALLVVFAYALLKLKWHPVLVSAQVVTSFIVLAWFSKQKVRQYNLRFALSAVVLILSAALSPELIIGALAFAYFLFGSMALWDYYLIRFVAQDAFKTRVRHRRVPLFAVTVVVLVLSLVVFPILPRPQKKWQAQMGAGWSRIGLSGSVELNSDFRARSQDRSVAFRVVMTDVGARRALVESQSELWRGRTLEVLSDSGWYASLGTLNAASDVQEPLLDVATPHEIELVREPTSLNIVSAPYGTAQIVSRNFEQSVLRSEQTGDFRLSKPVADYLKFGLTVQKYKAPKAVLSPTLTRLPAALNFSNPKWAEWLKLGRGLKSPEEKMALVERTFASQGLQWSISGDKFEGLTARQQLERFLFESKKGHCEFFATAAALLLRHWGVPTRLVTGYRTNQGYKQNLLVVYESDAHAWLEVVNSQGRWVAFDPTPAARPSTLPIVWDYFSNLKNRLETGWYLYVLDFDAAQALKLLKDFTHANRRPLVGVVALLAVAMIARWLGRRRPLRLINGRRDRRKTPWPLRRMAQWIIDLEHRRGRVLEHTQKPHDFDPWFRDFQKVRFDRQKASSDAVNALYRVWKQNRKAWQKGIQ